MGTFDYREADNRLADADANRDCLACGSSDVSWADRRYALIEVADNGRIELDANAGTALAIYAGARICNTCGFIRLHALLPLVR